MQRLATSLLLLLLCGTAHAQLTITQSDVETLIGETRTRTDFAADGPAATIQALIDAEGGDQTWDFTTLAYDAGTPAVETYSTEAPDGAPGADEAPFDAATLVATQEVGADSVYYSFLDLRGDGAYFLGFSATRNGTETERGTYDSAIRSFALPLSYGAEWTTNGTLTLVAEGQAFTVQEQRTNEVDGYGTLVLPSGSFETLRLRQTISATASGFTTTQTVYTWYDRTFQALASAVAIEVPVVGTTIYSASYSEIEDDTGGGGTAPPASAPAELTPADGAGDQPTDVTLAWGDLEGATSYDVQVADAASFSKTLTLIVDEQGLTATSYDLDGLDAGTAYYWRVRGRNEGGAGPWATQHFTTAAASPEAPGTVTLSSPPDGTTDAPTTLTLSWQAAATAASYQLQVAPSDDFAATAIDETGLTDTSREVGPLASSTTYYWRVRAANEGGDGPWSATRSFTTLSTVSVEDATGRPTTYALHASYPNPFNPSTTIRFDLPHAGPAMLTVYDATGRLATRLVDATLPAGTHRVAFDGAGLPSGLYIYTLQAGGVSHTRTMVLLK